MTEVYYVEDDENIAQSVKEYLNRMNCKVIICGTVKEAKEILSAHLPSIVLVDWNMPDSQGDGLCQWIRRRWKYLPVIFLTVRGDTKDIVYGFQNGADDYVVKPFELEFYIPGYLRCFGEQKKIVNQCCFVIRLH